MKKQNYRDAPLRHEDNPTFPAEGRTRKSLLFCFLCKDRTISDHNQGTPKAPQLSGHLLTFSDYGIAALIGLAALIVYVRTLAPTITGEDSGEFVTASYVLGIPHPPGYPLYCLVAHAFTWLPFGEVAWRVNLMSAVFGAGTIFWLCLTMMLVTRCRWASCCAALVFACSREFWAQAVIAEVYTMSLFIMAWCFFLLLCWSHCHKDTTLYLFAWLFGLGMTVHNTFVLLVPGCTLYMIWVDYVRRACIRGYGVQRVKVYAACFVIAAAALLVYLYLPIRSSANPPLDWGDPETFLRVVRHILRAQYNFMVYQYPRNFGRFLSQMTVYGKFWLGEFTPIVGMAGVIGLATLFQKNNAFVSLIVISTLGIIAGFSLWQNFELTREWLWVMRVFGLPVYYVTAIGVGGLLGFLSQKREINRKILYGFGILCFLAPLILHFERNDKSSYYWTRDYGINLLHSLEQDAIYVSESDHGSFSVLYLQTVFGMRPDVENLRKYGYLSSRLFDKMPEYLRNKIGLFPPRRYDPEIIAWLVDNTTRPVYLSKYMRLPTSTEVHLVPAGLALRVLRPHETAPSTETYWQNYRWSTLCPWEARGDYTADAIRYEIFMAKSREIFMTSVENRPNADRHRCALQYIEIALSSYGRDPIVLNNAGVLCARYGAYQAAEKYFKEALSKLPNLAEPGRNLERLQNKLSRSE